MASNNRDNFTASIGGLREFINSLGVAPRYLDAAEEVFMATAAATVVVRAKEIAAGEGRQQKKAASMGVARGNQPGTVTYGGFPWAMGAEFGALQWKQFPNWRGNKDEAGYFFWPAIRDFRDNDMLELWVKEAWKVIKPAFPDWLRW